MGRALKEGQATDSEAKKGRLVFTSGSSRPLLSAANGSIDSPGAIVPDLPL